MTAEAEQKHFWDIYEQILMENGEPFFLAPNARQTERLAVMCSGTVRTLSQTAASASILSPGARR